MLPSDDDDGLDVHSTHGASRASREWMSGPRHRHITDEDDFNPTRADGGSADGPTNVGPVPG